RLSAPRLGRFHRAPAESAVPRSATRGKPVTTTRSQPTRVGDLENFTGERMPGLDISGLNTSYETRRALTDMTCTASDRKLRGVVGSTGAGKTTTLRIALGVLTADSGTASFGGRPMDPNLRRRVGYMPEERGLYPKMKVSDQLVYLAEL